ncbi:hypothetical protein PMKS-002324 [Pichia membranifaciens]|uniref:tRNA (guanine(37)-N1)-methyltransferase n=1 Tax=Pichia membranifaciens TaxID=4926 RepID=A0A1Q2YH18_9ASCO|nr:hypothetical protein PMKS-002324 [Pichia membranifaciens]
MSTYIPLSQLKPPRNPGMKKLDKSKFVINRNVWALFLPEIKYANEFLGRKGKKKSDESIVLSIPQHPSLIEFPKDTLSASLVSLISPKNPKLKAILLKEDIKVTDEDEKHVTEDNYEPELLRENVIESTYLLLKKLGPKYKIYNIAFDFDYWSYDDILKAILPEDLIENCPSAFTVAGHLAHLNLKEQYMPYRNIIGEVILNKFPNIKTVVNKTNNITSEFRTFQMEVLAGEDNFIVTQKECGCLFTFDFQKVYWNSRLATEHERLIDSFGTGEVVCDVMAGVGPFAVPAGKKPCLVFANDLNPESYKYLKENIETNKVSSFVEASNLDGREFIKQSPKILQNFKKSVPSIKYNDKCMNSKSKADKGGHSTKKRTMNLDVPLFVSHYVMNLPDSAITFVDSYIGLFSNGYPSLSKEEVKQLTGYKLPVINVHHFEKYKEEEIEGDVEEELKRRMHQKVVEQLNFEIPIQSLKFHLVRQVAPCKLMYCISFELPEEVAFATQ